MAEMQKSPAANVAERRQESAASLEAYFRSMRIVTNFAVIRELTAAPPKVINIVMVGDETSRTDSARIAPRIIPG
jgi:hypothetical protein